MYLAEQNSCARHRRREIIDDKIAAGEAGDDLKKLAATIITIDEPENGTGAIKVRTVNRERPCRRCQGRRTGQRRLKVSLSGLASARACMIAAATALHSRQSAGARWL